MQTPNIFLAYTPRGAGLRCALAYLTTPHDAYGWFTGPRQDTTVASCYFLLEGLFTKGAARYEAVDAGALHAAWSLDEARFQELARLQETLSCEWLFYRDDPRVAAELEAYAEGELAAGEVNLRFERTVLRHLAGRWPLEYRPHGDEIRFVEHSRP